MAISNPFTSMHDWLKWHFRHGPHYGWYHRLLACTARYSPEQLADYQNRRLQAMIRHCYREVPYYRDLFNRLGLRPEDLMTVQDLRKLPLLDKQTVNAHFDKLQASRRFRLLSRVTRTSGTTGSPACFVRDYPSVNFEQAAVSRQWQLAGDRGQRRITLRGELVVPMAVSRPPFWRYNPAARELLMSGFHLNKANSAAYLDEILRFQPGILSSYPSNALVLARFFRQRRIAYRFDAVFTSSENIQPAERACIEETFQAPVYDWYGQAERVAAICDCRAGRYHVQEDYSIVELLGDGPECEVVGTHLFNRAMPLLRYQTGDRVVPDQAPCPCGSHFRRVARIAGRPGSFLLTPEGYRISAANHIFHGIDNIIEAQLYQERTDELVIRVVSNGLFAEADRLRLVNNATLHTSPTMRVIVEETETIPRGANGKFSSIVNCIHA